MKKKSKIFGVTFARLLTIVKIIVIGALLTESYYLGYIAGERIGTLHKALQHPKTTGFLLALTATLIAFYIITRTSYTAIRNIITSGRIDLLLALSTGFFVSRAFHGHFSKHYEKATQALEKTEITTLALIPIAIALIIFIRAATLKLRSLKTYESSPIFLSDTEQKSKKDDLLGISNSAEKFAERVLNGGSTESLVFGLDAPWGIGKSSFINFCIEYWNENQKNAIIVYKFNPLPFDDSNQLVEKFIDGLIAAIQESAFIPEIRPIISKYSRLISEKSEFSISEMKFGVSTAPSIDSTIDDLKSELGALNKKIIVAIDDLDRIEFSSIKKILFAIKKCFSLPNISYVLCYDSENISTFAEDYLPPSKTIEFLEKFINLKTSIYIDSRSLVNFITKDLDQTIKGNFQADPLLVSKATEGLVEIFNADNYHKYRQYVGDIRKLKRIINTIIILDIDQTDFDNSDINKKDLINLILVYITYPNIFRKIYETETNGKFGLFSLVDKYDPRHPQYASDKAKQLSNSQLFGEYTSKIDEDQKFLIDQLFNASVRLEGDFYNDISEESWRSLACFNGCSSGHSNLEAYLNLIINSSKPKKQTQYRFFAKIKNDIKNGKSLSTILERKDFSTSESEENHKHLWRILINSSSELSTDVAAKLIKYLRDYIPKHSIYENKTIGLGLRDDLHYHLIKLLDSSGWSHDSDRRDNSKENIQEISDWIFGENTHAADGILKTLMNTDRGILGLYDTLKFRLYCSADRGGNIYNLTRALSYRANPKSPTDGLVSEIAKYEMREISQKTFQLFKKSYIDNKINIFSLINNLDITDLLGDWHDFFNEKVKSGEANLIEADEFLQILKSRLRLFISYQLGSKNDKNGICCGYYDATGIENNGEISRIFNDYLFEICFTPNESNSKAYEYFVEFLLSSLLGSPLYDDEKPKPHISHFTKTLDASKLTAYWETHKTRIKKKEFNKMHTKIITSNFKAKYSDFVDDIFILLDTLTENESENA